MARACRKAPALRGLQNTMKSIIPIVAVTLVLLLGSCSDAEQSIDWNDAEISWHDYENGLDQIRASGNNGLIIIYADWCPTCKQYSKLFRNTAVIRALEHVVLIRANKDKEPDVSRQFNVDGDYVPRTFALDGNGNIIRDMDSNNPKWWYFLPANDPEHLIQFVSQLKSY